MQVTRDWELGRECLKHALVLMEAAKEAPESVEQLLFVAELWMKLAAIENANNGDVDHAHKSN